MEVLFQNFKDVFAFAFLQTGGYGSQFRQASRNTNKNLSYPAQFFRMEKFQGPWKEVARTPNSVQQFMGNETIHNYRIEGSGFRYRLVENGREINRHLNVHTQDKNVAFTDADGNLFSNPGKIRLLGLYDQKLDYVTDPDSQSYVFALLAQEGTTNAWILARPGSESHSQGVNHLMNFAQGLGYNTVVTNPALTDMKREASPAPTPAPAPAPTPDDSKSHDVLVLWTRESFPEDGSGRVLNIEKNRVIRFRSIDDDLHTVAEAAVVKNDDEPSGRKWIPHPNPRISSPAESVGFNRTLRIGDEGTYYLVCPVETHHRVMRLQVNVYDSNDNDVEDVLNGMNNAK
ncbi:hypothetical protein BH23THE1_BH23THE1_28370 [soil metagenome]